MGVDIPVIWFAIIVFATLMYIIMDGFDLGIGMLFSFVGDAKERDVMVNSVAPVWDGNETWLVLGGAGLLAAFPLAYSVVLSALYLPLTLMLVGLIFRGVAFEFRFKATPARRHVWDKAFIGGAFDWLHPFALFCGFGLIAGYALLGSTWLIMKTEGELQIRMRQIASRLAWVLLGVIVAVSIWTPLAHAEIAARWFSFPNVLWFAPVPVLVAVTMALLLRTLAHGAGDTSPFVLTLVMIFLAYSGLGISVWPNVIPPDVSIWAAAGPPQSLGFALVGALLIVPVILMYTAWAYWVFRGKVRHGDGYH